MRNKQHFFIVISDIIIRNFVYIKETVFLMFCFVQNDFSRCVCEMSIGGLNSLFTYLDMVIWNEVSFLKWMLS